MEKQMNQEESIAIIRRMIDNAKSAYQESGTIYLIWGWVVLVASLTHFVLLEMTDFKHPYAAWLLIIVGIVASIVQGIQDNSKQTVSTFVDDFMKYIWSAFGVTLTIVLVFMGKIGMESTYPIVLLIYGIGLYISGGALQFRPLILGGIACWAIAVVAFFFPFNIQLLLLALAVALGYIIPGHMLQAKYKGR